MHACTHMYVVWICVLVFVHVRSRVGLHVAAFQTRLVRSGPVTGNPDPIWIRVHCGPDTLVI